MSRHSARFMAPLRLALLALLACWLQLLPIGHRFLHIPFDSAGIGRQAGELFLADIAEAR